MAVYKFKVSFEEYEDIYRVIEIKSPQTFLDLHKAILDSIGFDQKQEITLEDMSDDEDEDSSKKIPIMKKAQLQDYIDDPHQKIIYIYDFIEMWTLHLELVGIEMKEKAGVKYPTCTKTIGPSPKQYDKIQKFGLVDDDEFEEITKNYLDKTDEIPGEISDEEADEFGLFGDEQGEAGGEEL
jgi:hypothetical protein